jgi:hypothetical protein
MGTNHTSGLGRKVGNGVDKLRTSRVGMDIKDKYFTGVQSCTPEIASIKSKTHMMSLVSPANRHVVYNFAVLWRAWVYINRDQFILLIAYAFHTKGPDIYEILLAGYLNHIVWQTGFVGLY